MPSFSAKITRFGPSLRISVIVSAMDLVADCESSPRWRSIEAMTSSASRVFPLWNSTPWRRLKVHSVAPWFASQDSASSGPSCPSDVISVSWLPML